ncbi:isochorismatase family protein [Streptomyces sp. WAC06614]|uniref:isochorismatase family protein n=1 Tax=Streptomyces sp. WAC06614 TaxID=2487416 RepID=UPI000F770DD1|nr:isochorismatase family protein [Streptomyces sp. WAC06614]RSS80751.1 isochorismatase family protein [Streptomyces sp. WAC06614]
MAGLPTVESYPLPTPETLPENVARWTPDPDRAVLLVHDMQRYFLAALPDPLRADVVHHAAQVRKRAAALGVPVAYTAQPGGMTEEQRGLLKDFWGPGMRTDAADRAVVPELAPEDGDWVLTKWRYSAFFRSDLLARMRAAGRDQLVLCGVYAHVGVLATALEAYTHDIQAFVVADAVGDFSEAHHTLALTYVAQRCGSVLTAQEVFA